jgi:hypothetical protein
MQASACPRLSSKKPALVPIRVNQPWDKKPRPSRRGPPQSPVRGNGVRDRTYVTPPSTVTGRRHAHHHDRGMVRSYSRKLGVGSTLPKVVTRFCSRNGFDSCQFRHNSGLDTLAVTTRFRLGSGFRLDCGFDSVSVRPSVPVSTRLRFRLGHGIDSFPPKCSSTVKIVPRKPICLLLSGTNEPRHYPKVPVSLASIPHPVQRSHDGES